jgi:hypothetical protein
MIECVINYLVSKYDVKRDVAFIFYMEILDRHKINDLIVNMHKFNSFEELKNHYLGGNKNELQ